MNILSDPKFLWYLMRGTGEVVLVLLTLTTALGIASTARMTSRFWPRFATQALHRNVSLITVGLLLGHVISAALHSYIHLSWLAIVLPFVGDYQPLWIGLGAIAVDIMAIVIVTSLMRHRMSHGPWRVIHLFSYACWLVAVVHSVGIGTDQRSTAWGVGVTAVCVGVVTATVVVRLVTFRHERVLAETGV